MEFKPRICPSHTIVTVPTTLPRDLRLPPAQKVTRKCISWFCGKLRAIVCHVEGQRWLCGVET